MDYLLLVIELIINLLKQGILRVLVDFPDDAIR
jgi:hypothetical protein